MTLFLRRFLFVLALLVPALFSACDTTESGSSFQGIQSNRISPAAMAAAIKAEAPGDYWIGRRFYKVDYKFWGYLRRPGQPWSTAQLVLMNEQQQLAPDRASGHIGSDNGYEYKLYGEFEPQQAYEPASNAKYPVFVLKRAELITTTPPNIFRTPGATDPTRRVIPKPS